MTKQQRTKLRTQSGVIDLPIDKIESVWEDPARPTHSVVGMQSGRKWHVRHSADEVWSGGLHTKPTPPEPIGEEA